MYAPKTLKELYKQLENYFGDSHQASTAWIKMDQLQQTGTAEEYILRFQALMLSTGYNCYEYILFIFHFGQSRVTHA